MHEFSVNIGNLRNALLTLVEYRPRRKECYDTEQYEDGTYAGEIYSSHDYHFDNKVRFDVGSSELILAIVSNGYSVKVSIPCISNEPGVSFCLHLNKLINSIERLDTEATIIVTEERFFGYHLKWNKYYDPHQAYSVEKWPEYPEERTIERLPAPIEWLPCIVDTFKDFVWDEYGDQDSDYIWISISDGKCTYWCHHQSWVCKKTIQVKYPNVQKYSLHHIICTNLHSVLQNVKCDAIYLSVSQGYSILSYGNVVISMKSEGTVRHFCNTHFSELATIEKAYSISTPDSHVTFKTELLRAFIRRAKAVCDSREYLFFHLKDNYLFCHSYNRYPATAIDEFVPLLCEKKDEKIWRIKRQSLENLLSDIHSDYCSLLYVSEKDPGPIFIESLHGSKNSECFSMCGAGKLLEEDNQEIDLTEKNLYQIIEKTQKNTRIFEGPITFAIGKKFPYPIETGRDSIRPYPTYDGLSIVMVYCNLTQLETESILDKPCNVGLVQLGIIPFIVFNFSNVIQQDVSLNIQKIQENERKKWINDIESRILTLYLVEGTDGTLVGIRIFELKLLDDLRTICSYQLYSKIEEIDYMIQVNESIYDVHRMWSKAFKIENIDTPMII